LLLPSKFQGGLCAAFFIAEAFVFGLIVS